MAKTLTAEQKKILATGKRVGVFPFEFAEDTAAGSIPTSIHLIPIGTWDHDLYGPIIITSSAIQQFVRNFDAKIRKGVFVTAGHEGFSELPAQGWITRVYARDDGLWGDVEWNELGKATLEDKQFKFFSPEFYPEYADPETHEVYQNVLTGGALTKSPYFKELEAVVFSDKNISKTFSDNQTMNIQDILKKKASERSAEEAKFLTDNKATMSESEKTQFEGEAADAIKASEKETGDANEAKGLNRDGSAKVVTAKEPIVADDKGMVKISAAEFAILTGKADEGAKAFKELGENKLTAAVSALMFSESNKSGKFMPKSEATLKTFMEKLNDEQRKQFSDLIAQLPDQKLFSELGESGAGATGTVVKEVEAKVATIQASDKNIKYSDALRKVFSETPGLQARYDKELQG